MKTARPAAVAASSSSSSSGGSRSTQTRTRLRGTTNTTTTTTKKNSAEKPPSGAEPKVVKVSCCAQVKRKLPSLRKGQPANGPTGAKRERTDQPELLRPVAGPSSSSSSSHHVTSRTRSSKGASHSSRSSKMQPASSLESTTTTSSGDEAICQPRFVDDDEDDERVARLRQEKLELERHVAELVANVREKQSEITGLEREVDKLKEQRKSHSDTLLYEMESIQAENRLLRERLEALGLPIAESALSDSEKVILLQKCNSAPPSLNGGHSNHLFFCSSKRDLLDGDFDVGDAGSCVLPRPGGMMMMDGDRAPSERGSLDWEKQSNSSVSEMSVACLQDRILQMEETHYSTSEELQATLQELSDLQDQLADCQVENERLNDEKSVLLESLCKQTERLKDYRTLNDNLRQLLFEQAAKATVGEVNGGNSSSGSNGDTPPLTTAEREQRMLELLKNVQDEKELLQIKCDELRGALQAAKHEAEESRREALLFSERARIAASEVEASKMQRRALEKKLADDRASNTAEQVEAARMRALLESERARVAELQQCTQQAREQPELELLLDTAREEKDRLEAAHSALKEQLAHDQCEVDRLRELIAAQQQESSVTAGSLQKQLGEAEFKLEQAMAEKALFQHEKVMLQESVREAERRCQRHIEEKRDLRSIVSDLQKKLNEASGRAETLERQLDDQRQRHDNEAEEWRQFQNDLLMTVRVANDFKTEAQQDVEKLIIENRQLKEQIRSLQAENERLKAMKTTTSPPGQRRVLQAPPNYQGSDGNVLAAVDSEMVSLRQARATARGDVRLSVRTLIESIENSSKCTKNGADGIHTGPSVSPPPSAMGSAELEKAPLVPILRRGDENIYPKPSVRPASSDAAMILREQKNATNVATQPLRPLQRNSYTEGVGSKNNGSSAKSSPEKIGTTSLVGKGSAEPDAVKSQHTPVSILATKLDALKRNSFGDVSDKKDPLASLAKGGGSRRNALLKWCQSKTMGYKGIDITNFSSSWNDGLALCAMLHTYLPDKIPYEELDSKDKRRNFTLAFKAAESVGIPTILNINDMISVERPDWQSVMAYVTSIYKHFET